MAYVALYRKWRPMDFDALVGQDSIKQALMNALDSKRIAHAYLFTGPRGTGKTSTARILAKALNCEKGPTSHPCNECSNCTQITLGNAMDVCEMDAASNRSVDDIEELCKNAVFAPVNGRYKVYIIDEVHMLTKEAYNALLKTLEEPPAHVVFILATTDPQQIPATIHSRCQRFDFKRVTVNEIIAHLKFVAEGSGIDIDDEAVRLIAVHAEGGMRDALSLLDQCGVSGSKVTVESVRNVLGLVGREGLRELVTLIGKKNVTGALEVLNELVLHGKDLRQILVEIAEYLRAVLLYQASKDYQEVYITDSAEAFDTVVPFFSPNRIMAAEETIHKALTELRWAVRGRIVVEMCMYDLCRMEGSTMAALVARVEELETALRSGNVAKVASGAPVTLQASAQKPVEKVAPLKVETKVEPIAEQKLVPKPQPVPEVKKQEEPAVKLEVPVVTAPAPKAEQVDAAYTPYTGDWAVGDEAWHKALDLLNGEKKRAMVACVSGASVLAFEKNILTIGFKNDFSCKRMKQDDYKTTFEDALLRVSRLPIKLNCVVDAGAKAQAEPVKVEKVVEEKVETSVEFSQETTAPVETKEPAEDLTQKALGVFGGTVHKADS